MPRTVRTLFALLSLLLLVGTAVSTPPAQVAFAGPKSNPNAKQINFSCTRDLFSVTVTGHNQYPNTKEVKWTFSNTKSTPGDRTASILTKGWWWVGPVEITWKRATGNGYFGIESFGPMRITLPTPRNTDTIDLYCPSK